MFARLRVNRPASTSSTIEKAICAVVSVARKRAEPRPLTARAPCAFMTCPGFAPLMRQAGTRPNTSTVASDAPAANRSAVGLNAASPSERFDGQHAGDQPHDQRGHEQAREPADRDQHERFGEQRFGELQTPAAERRANRHLAAARRAAREQQIRDVHADDQQHKRRHADQQLERALCARAEGSPAEVARARKRSAAYETARAPPAAAAVARR